MAGPVSAQKFLIPRTAMLQYAGSIGFLSAGFGYDLFKKDKGSLDLAYGFVPGSKGGPLNILSVKFAYKPFKISLGDWADLLPLNPGVFISYHLGSDYSIGWDNDIYPKGYYWWSTAIRPNLSVSTELKLHSQKLVRAARLRAVSLYYEISTNDLYLLSFIQNHDEFNFFNILKAGIGTRIYF